MYFLKKKQHVIIKLGIVFFVVGLFLGLELGSVQAQPGSEACSEKSLGDECSFTKDSQQGRPTINGVCADQAGTLTCKDTNGLDKTDPCSDASVGDSCTKTVEEKDNRGNVTGTTEKNGFCNVGTSNIFCKVDSSNDTGDDPTGGGDGTENTGSDDDTGGDDTGEGSDDGPGGPSASPQTITFQNPLNVESIPELVGAIVRGLLGLLGTLALLIIIYGGLRYMTSINNPNEAKQYIQVITNAVIGLVIIIAAFLVVQYIISALLSTSS